MKSLINEISSYLGLEIHITEKILYSLIIIFLAIIVRWVTVGVLSRRLAGAKEKYDWIRAAKYIISALNIILLFVVWGSEFQSLATFGKKLIC